MFEDLHQEIKRNAEQLLAGHDIDVARCVQALRSIRPEHHAIAPVLEKLLTAHREDVRLESALALGNLGSAGSAQVPALQALSKDPSFLVAGAALWALGQIGTPAAIDTLVNELKNGPRERLHFVAGAFEVAGASAEGALPILHRMARDKSISERVRHELRSAIGKIYAGVRQGHWQNAMDSGFTDYVSLDRLAIHPSLFSYFAPYTVPVNLGGEGLVHDGRFRFTVNNVESELGLKIYGKANGDTIVVLAVDERWYGAYPTNWFESITTAVMHMYGIDPNRTRWIEHYTPQAGLSITSCCEVVQRFDEDQGWLHNPIWGPSETLAAILLRHGLEP